MLNVIDATEGTAITTPDGVLPESPAALPECHQEQILGDEITNLWSAHATAKNTARATRDELRALRARLGAQLSTMKDILAKPGRDGQWSRFLRERQIPRATGDRLVTHHLRSLNPDENCVTESVLKPTEEEMMKCFGSVLPRLKRFLSMPCGLYNFVGLLASHYRECTEATDRGILVLSPALATICPSSPDSDSVVDLEFTDLPEAADQQIVPIP